MQHIGDGLGGEEHCAAEELPHGEEVELERRDDAEVRLAAPDRPEELGVAVRCDRVDRAVGRDHLHGANMVGSEAEAAGEVAHSPAQRVPDDPDARRRPGQRRKAEGRGSVDDLAPGDAGLDPRAAPVGVDLHALQALRRDEDRACRPPARPSVAGRLDLDGQPFGGRVAHRGCDVATATGRHHDAGRWVTAVLNAASSPAAAGSSPWNIAPLDTCASRSSPDVCMSCSSSSPRPHHAARHGFDSGTEGWPRA